MDLLRSFLTFAAVGTISLSAADLAQISTAKRWEAYECTAVQSGKGMTVNMPIDHKGGEKAYPIGWPRLYLRKMVPAEKDWSKAKALTFKFKLEFKGKTAKYPITFQIRTQASPKAKPLGHMMTIPGLINNKEVTVTLPLNKVKDLKNVLMLGINISESQYKHGENLKFTIRDFKLISK